MNELADASSYKRLETCFSWVYAVWETRDTGLIVDKSLVLLTMDLVTVHTQS